MHLDLIWFRQMKQQDLNFLYFQFYEQNHYENNGNLIKKDQVYQHIEKTNKLKKKNKKFLIQVKKHSYLCAKVDYLT